MEPFKSKIGASGGNRTPLEEISLLAALETAAFHHSATEAYTFNIADLRTKSRLYV
jgi:hypothetical protein